MATRPLLYGFKFISPSPRVGLSVKRHADVAVLTAVIHQCWLRVVMADGSLLHHCVLKVGNSRTQYVRVRLPDPGAELWSTYVSGSPVKPSRDETGQLLVPLAKRGMTLSV